jgi:hypothetical protein
MTTRTTQILILSLLGYATCGLVLSLAVNLGSLAGFQPPRCNALFAGLHGGTFALVLALILISKLRPGTTDIETDNWRLPVFLGCPAWMNYMARGFHVYALINFAVVFLMNLVSTGTLTLSMSHSFGAGDPSIASWRGFSSLWMTLYATGLAILTSAYRVGKSTNGHSTCGAPVDGNSNQQNSGSCGAELTRDGTSRLSTGTTGARDRD